MALLAGDSSVFDALLAEGQADGTHDGRAGALSLPPSRTPRQGALASRDATRSLNLGHSGGWALAQPALSPFSGKPIPPPPTRQPKRKRGKR